MIINSSCYTKSDVSASFIIKSVVDVSNPHGYNGGFWWLFIFGVTGWVSSIRELETVKYIKKKRHILSYLTFPGSTTVLSENHIFLETL